MSSETAPINVLIADGDAKSRAYIADVLKMRGVNAIEVKNSNEAKATIQDTALDACIVDDTLLPDDGFDVARYAKTRGKKIGMIMLTQNPTTDILMEAGNFGIGQVMKKPVEPDRLLEPVKRILHSRGKNLDSFRSDMARTYQPRELMERAIALARQNARSGLGGPFAAIVTDKKGLILGEGVNSVYGRSDPTAHAEVLAIRRATESTNNIRLEGCHIYCSSEPTMLGQALIIGTGIAKVYYGISHMEAGVPRADEQDIFAEINKPPSQRTVPFEQLCKDEASEVFKNWLAQPK
jgi:tRNA(Arg) A34 adenosine deaminase TadA